MRRLLPGIAILLALVVTGAAAVKLTVEDRAAGAQRSLERAAARLAACHRQEGTYSTCRFDASGVFVQSRTRGTFALMSAVEFGPTYELRVGRRGRVVRTCHPLGRHCAGTW